MTDELDRTISAELGREADRFGPDLPSGRSRLDRRVQRFHRRRVAVAGLTSALILVVGTAVWTTLDDDPSVRVESFGPPSPTSTPTDSVASTAPPATGMTPVVVATGWGVVVTDGNGAQRVVEDLSGGTGSWDYRGTSTIDGREVVQRISRAYSDLQGGVVYGTDNAIVWLPADGSRHVLAWVAPLDLATELSESVDLEDVVVIDGSVQVVYTQTTIHTGLDFNGTAQLVALPLDGGDPNQVETYSWEGTGPDWQYYGQVSYADGKYTVVRSWNQGSCTWIDVLGPDGTVEPGAGPYPRPADPASCPYDAIEAVSLSDDGSELAVVRGAGQTLERYSMADGTLIASLPTALGQEPVAIDDDGSVRTVAIRAACQGQPDASGGCGELASASIARGDLVRAPIATITPDDPRWVTDIDAVVLPN